MKDIRKLAHGVNDKEMFINWASILGKAHSSILDEIPQVAERVKIRQVIKEQRELRQNMVSKEQCQIEIQKGYTDLKYSLS